MPRSALPTVPSQQVGVRLSIAQLATLAHAGGWPLAVAQHDQNNFSNLSDFIRASLLELIELRGHTALLRRFEADPHEAVTLLSGTHRFKLTALTKMNRRTDEHGQLHNANGSSIANFVAYSDAVAQNNLNVVLGAAPPSETFPSFYGEDGHSTFRQHKQLFTTFMPSVETFAGLSASERFQWFKELAYFFPNLTPREKTLLFSYRTDGISGIGADCTAVHNAYKQLLDPADIATINTWSKADIAKGPYNDTPWIEDETAHQPSDHIGGNIGD